MAHRGLKRRNACFAGLLTLSGAATAADVTIYDETLENTFSTDYSYFNDDKGVLVVGSTDVARSGTHSIKYVGSDFSALSFTHAATYSTANYPYLHFWIYGAAPGAQDYTLQIYPNKDSGGATAQAPLDSFIVGGSIANQAWREVIVPLTQSPLSFTGTFNRIDLQSEANGATQPAVYLDDIALQLSVAPDPIFKNGFDLTTQPTLPPLVQDSITLDNLASDRFTWYDSANQPRVAVLAHNDSGTAPGGSHGGELRQFRYQVAGSQRIVSAPGRLDGGFGYIVSHPHSESACVAGDSSTLGHLVAGTWERVFTGRHHAIFRFKQNYPRYCTENGPAAEHDIPVTIDWIFSTGRDNPIWAVTYDMHAIGANVLDDDSRSPYGTLNIDGSSGMYMDNNVRGIGWGDRFQFATIDDAAYPEGVTLSNPWDWTLSNTIPYVELWMGSNDAPPDATMGLVQTQTMTQQDAGGGRKAYGNGSYDVSAYWGQHSPPNACPDGSDDGQTGLAHSLPCVQFWPYQANSFSYGDLTDATNDAKMTWGTQYGFLGQMPYPLNDSQLPAGSTATGYPKRSYSVYVILGPHTGDPVGTQRVQVETQQTDVSLGINSGVGSVATSGPPGIKRSDETQTYAPPGYDPINGALTFVASASSTLDATISISAGTLHKPLIVMRNYTSANPPTHVSFAGTALTADADYYASIRPADAITNDPPIPELWITLNRDVTGAGNRLQIAP